MIINKKAARIQQLYRQHGLLAFVGALFFPFLLMVVNPIRFAKTLWFSRVLLVSKGFEYVRYRPVYGVNSLFYWNQALNLKEFGKKGTSPFLGNGDYALNNWWYLSNWSLFLQWRHGASLSIYCMFIWLSAHLVWLSTGLTDHQQILMVLFACLVSSYFYANAFIVQNYNVVGWLFLPIIIFGLHQELPALATIALFTASFASITVVFFCFWVCLVVSIQNSDPLFMLIGMPAFAKVGFDLIKADNFFKRALNTLRNIGFGATKSNTKYSRNLFAELLKFNFLYFVSIWIIFACSLFFYGNNFFAALMALGIFLWVLNNSIFRFADNQSFHMYVFSICTASVIADFSYLNLFLLWLVVSPLPTLIGSASPGSPINKPTPYKPFHITPLINKCMKFLGPVPRNQKVLLVLANPKGKYSNIFEGYREILELLFYCGSKSKINIFPDWYSIFEENNSNQNVLWGTSPDQVVQNLRESGARFFILTVKPNYSFERDFKLLGCEVVDEFDWEPLIIPFLQGEPAWNPQVEPPKWVLVKISGL